MNAEQLRQFEIDEELKQLAREKRHDAVSVHLNPKTGLELMEIYIMEPGQ